MFHIGKLFHAILNIHFSQENTLMNVSKANIGIIQNTKPIIKKVSNALFRQVNYLSQQFGVSFKSKNFDRRKYKDPKKQVLVRKKELAEIITKY